MKTAWLAFAAAALMGGAAFAQTSDTSTTTGASGDQTVTTKDQAKKHHKRGQVTAVKPGDMRQQANTPADLSANGSQQGEGGTTSKDVSEQAGHPASPPKETQGTSRGNPGETS